MSKREFLATLSIKLNNKLQNCNPTVVFSEELSDYILKIETNNQPFFVNIEAVYQAHIHGMTIEAIVDALCDSMAIRDNEPQQALYEIAQHFESASPFLYATVESAINNDSLKTKPYFRFMDLAVTYYIEFIMQNGAVCKATLTDDVFENWGITADMLHDTAVTNTFTKKNPQIVPLVNAIPSEALTMPLKDELNSLLVISNESTMFGAINMFNVDILNNAAFLLCSKEIYIIPSSIHEIIVCAKDNMDSEQLKALVQEVNGSFVREDEILSNNLYLFNRETMKIAIL